MAKIDSLLSRASEVRDATLEKENTALRVGSLFVDLIQTITAVLPREILEASGISVAASASDVTISYKKILNDGSAGTGRITIPAVTETGAGVITPALLARIREGLTDISEAIRAAGNAQTSADTANTTAANNTALIKQLQGNLQIVDWILKSISAGTAAPDSVKAKMRRVNAWSSEEDEREIVLLPAATEEAAGAMTAQHVKDLKLAKGFMVTKGKADGLAPLDANKLIPEANIPRKYDNILFFDSVQAGAIVTQPGSALLGADDEKATLIFSKARNRLVLGVAENAGGMPQKYYVNFPGSDRYGTPKTEGIRPASDKVYICRSTSLAYVWNGTTLAALVADYSSEFQSIHLDIAEINESKGEANGIAPLNADGVVPNENISDEARKSLFCDLFNAAAGSAGYAKFTNGVWDCKLNGLTLSYDEAVLIYNVTNGAPAVSGFAGTNIRTNLWGTWQYCAGPATDICPPLLFHRCPLLEVISFFNQLCWITEFRNMFDKCPELTKVIGVIGDGQSGAGSGIVELFPQSTKLTSFKLNRLQHNFSFANNPLIDLASFDYMVTNRVSTNTNNYTITVHPDVYAKLTGDTTNEAAAALTADELSQWQALLTKAAGKHIAFASA